jgi:hypothetical protein
MGIKRISLVKMLECTVKKCPGKEEKSIPEKWHYENKEKGKAKETGEFLFIQKKWHKNQVKKVKDHHKIKKCNDIRYNLLGRHALHHMRVGQVCKNRKKPDKNVDICNSFSAHIINLVHDAGCKVQGARQLLCAFVPLITNLPNYY